MIRRGGTTLRYKPEEPLLALLRTGQEGDLRPSLEKASNQTNVFGGASWGETRTLTANFLRHLLVNELAQLPIVATGLVIRGARISDELLLDNLTVERPLTFLDCYFDKIPNLRNAEFPLLRFWHCVLPGLSAHRVRTERDLELNADVNGPVEIPGARIGGGLFCGGSFTNAKGVALNADGAILTGDVHLRQPFNAEGAVTLRQIQIGGQLNCTSATFRNSDKAALDIDGGRVTGEVFLNEGFTAHGLVSCRQVQIGGQLICSSGTFINSERTALDADGARVSGAVFLNDGFSADGLVSLRHTQIGGPLNCTSATFANRGKCCFDAEGARVNSRVFLNRIIADGGVQLGGVEIGGELVCSGGSFLGADEGPALSAKDARVRGGILLDKDGDKALIAQGGISLVGSDIRGTLQCQGSFCRSPGSGSRGLALNAKSAKIAGSVFIVKDCDAEGQVSFQAAEIGGVFIARGTFANPGGVALKLDGASLLGGVYLDKNPTDAQGSQGFEAEGEVSLVKAEVKGELNCRGGCFGGPALNGDPADTRNALSAEEAFIKGDVLLGEGFRADGLVHLGGSTIEGGVDCGGGMFGNPQPGRAALITRGMKAGRFLWRPREPVVGAVDFTDTQVSVFVDSKTTWPCRGNLKLRGFEYVSIRTKEGEDDEGQELKARDRVDWLDLSSDYSPQPYEHLASVYRALGDEKSARTVRIAKENARRKKGQLSIWQRLVATWLWITVGYGYRAWLALVWLGGLWLAGVALLTLGPESHHAMSSLGTTHVAFHSWIYALDVLLPIVNLHQRDYFVANTGHHLGWLYEGHYAVSVVAGWLLAAALVASVAGVWKKD